MPNLEIELEKTRVELARLKEINAPVQMLMSMELKQNLLTIQIDEHNKQERIIAQLLGGRNE